MRSKSTRSTTTKKKSVPLVPRNAAEARRAVRNPKTGRKKTSIACYHCWKSKTRCGIKRPCDRCVRLGRSDCFDRPPASRKRQHRYISRKKGETPPLGEMETTNTDYLPLKSQSPAPRVSNSLRGGDKAMTTDTTSSPLTPCTPSSNCNLQTVQVPPSTAGVAGHGHGHNIPPHTNCNTNTNTNTNVVSTHSHSHSHGHAHPTLCINCTTTTSTTATISNLPNLPPPTTTPGLATSASATGTGVTGVVGHTGHPRVTPHSVTTTTVPTVSPVSPALPVVNSLPNTAVPMSSAPNLQPAVGQHSRLSYGSSLNLPAVGPLGLPGVPHIPLFPSSTSPVGAGHGHGHAVNVHAGITGNLHTGHNAVNGHYHDFNQHSYNTATHNCHHGHTHSHSHNHSHNHNHNHGHGQSHSINHGHNPHSPHGHGHRTGTGTGSGSGSGVSGHGSISHGSPPGTGHGTHGSSASSSSTGTSGHRTPSGHSGHSGTRVAGTGNAVDLPPPVSIPSIPSMTAAPAIPSLPSIPMSFDFRTMPPVFTPRESKSNHSSIHSNYKRPMFTKPMTPVEIAPMPTMPTLSTVSASHTMNETPLTPVPMRSNVQSQSQSHSPSTPSGVNEDAKCSNDDDGDHEMKRDSPPSAENGKKNHPKNSKNVKDAEIAKDSTTKKKKKGIKRRLIEDFEEIENRDSVKKKRKRQKVERSQDSSLKTVIGRQSTVSIGHDDADCSSNDDDDSTESERKVEEDGRSFVEDATCSLSEKTVSKEVSKSDDIPTTTTALHCNPSNSSSSGSVAHEMTKNHVKNKSSENQSTPHPVRVTVNASSSKTAPGDDDDRDIEKDLAAICSDDVYEERRKKLQQKPSPGGSSSPLTPGTGPGSRVGAATPSSDSPPDSRRTDSIVSPLNSTERAVLPPVPTMCNTPTRNGQMRPQNAHHFVPGNYVTTIPHFADAPRHLHTVPHPQMTQYPQFAPHGVAPQYGGYPLQMMTVVADPRMQPMSYIPSGFHPVHGVPHNVHPTHPPMYHPYGTPVGAPFNFSMVPRFPPPALIPEKGTASNINSSTPGRPPSHGTHSHSHAHGHGMSTGSMSSVAVRPH